MTSTKEKVKGEKQGAPPDFQLSRSLRLYKCLRKRKTKTKSYVGIQEYSSLLGDCMRSRNVGLKTNFSSISHLHTLSMAASQNKNEAIKTTSVLLSNLAASCRDKGTSGRCAVQAVLNNHLTESYCQQDFFSESSIPDHPLSILISTTPELLNLTLQGCDTELMRSEDKIYTFIPFFKFVLRKLPPDDNVLHKIFNMIAKLKKAEVFLYLLLWTKKLTSNQLLSIIKMGEVFLPPDVLCIIVASAVYRFTKKGYDIAAPMLLLRKRMCHTEPATRNIITVTMARCLLNCSVFQLRAISCLIKYLVSLPDISITSIMLLCGACTIISNRSEIIQTRMIPLLGTLLEDLKSGRNLDYTSQVSEDVEFLCNRFDNLSNSVILWRAMTTICQTEGNVLRWLDSLSMPHMPRNDPRTLILQSLLVCGTPEIKKKLLQTCKGLGNFPLSVVCLLSGQSNPVVSLQIVEVFFQHTYLNKKRMTKIYQTLVSLKIDNGVLLVISYYLWKRSRKTWFQNVHLLLTASEATLSYDQTRLDILKFILTNDPNVDDSSSPFSIMLFKLAEKYTEHYEMEIKILDCLYLLHLNPQRRPSDYLFKYCMNLCLTRMYNIKQRCLKMMTIWAINPQSLDKQTKQAFDLLWYFARDKEAFYSEAFKSLESFWLSCFTDHNLPESCTTKCKKPGIPGHCWGHLIQSCPYPEAITVLLSVLLRKEPRYGRNNTGLSVWANQALAALTKFLSAEGLKPDLKPNEKWIQVALNILDLSYRGRLKRTNLSFLALFIRHKLTSISFPSFKLLLTHSIGNQTTEGVLNDSNFWRHLNSLEKYMVYSMFPFASKRTAGVVMKHAEKHIPFVMEQLEAHDVKELLLLMDVRTSKSGIAPFWPVAKYGAQLKLAIYNYWLRTSSSDLLPLMSCFDRLFKDTNPASVSLSTPMIVGASNIDEARMKYEKCILLSSYRAIRDGNLNEIKHLFPTIYKFPSLRGMLMLACYKVCKFIASHQYKREGQDDLLLSYLLNPRGRQALLDPLYCFAIITMCVDTLSGYSELGAFEDAILRLPKGLRVLNSESNHARGVVLSLNNWCTEFDRELRKGTEHRLPRQYRLALWASYLRLTST